MMSVPTTSATQTASVTLVRNYDGFAQRRKDAEEDVL